MAAVDPYEDPGWRPRHGRNGKATILTPDLQGRIVNALRAGTTIQDACDYAGILRDRYYEWQRRGRDYDERLASDAATVPDEYEEGFRQFYLEVAKARAEARVRANLTIVSLMDAEQPPHVRFRASVFILERTDRKNWGRSVALTGADGGNIGVDVTDRTAEIARQIAQHVAAQRAVEAEIEEAEIVERIVDEADDLDVWFSTDDEPNWPGL